MKIGVLGTGMVGQTIGTKLLSLGHDVKMGSRQANNEKAVAWAAKTTGGKATTGTFADALATSDEQLDIVVTTNPNMPIPNWNFKGVPVGLDVRKIVATGIAPLITTPVMHKQAGIGQIGIELLQGSEASILANVGGIDLADRGEIGDAFADGDAVDMRERQHRLWRIR